MSSKRKRGTHKKEGDFLEQNKKSRQRQKRSSSTSQKFSVLSDSESEPGSSDDDFEDKKGRQKALHTCRRLRSRHKRKFHMPSRQEVWDKIPDTPCGRSASYTHLQPRKLVNNLIKENSRYNFDPAYTSGEDSIQDFIDDEIDNEESDSTETSDKSKNSDSHSASADHSDGSSNQYGRNLKKRMSRLEKHGSSSNCNDESMKGRHSEESEDTESDAKNNNFQSESDGSSNQYGKTLRKRRRNIRVKVLESSSDSDSGSQLTRHPTDGQTEQEDLDSNSTKSQNVNNNTHPPPAKSVMYRALKNYIQSKQPHAQMSNVMSGQCTRASSKNKNAVNKGNKRISDPGSSQSASESENSGESSDGIKESRQRRSKQQAARELFAEYKTVRAHRKEIK